MATEFAFESSGFGICFLYVAIPASLRPFGDQIGGFGGPKRISKRAQGTYSDWGAHLNKYIWEPVQVAGRPLPSSKRSLLEHESSLAMQTSIFFFSQDTY